MYLIVLFKFYFKMLLNFLKENILSVLLSYITFLLLFVSFSETLTSSTSEQKEKWILFGILFLICSNGSYYINNSLNDRKILINHGLEKVLRFIRPLQFFILSILILASTIPLLLFNEHLSFYMILFLMVTLLIPSFIGGMFLNIQRKNKNNTPKNSLFINRQKTSIFRSIYYLNLSYILRYYKTKIIYTLSFVILYNLIILFMLSNHILHNPNYLFLSVIPLLLFCLDINSEIYKSLSNYGRGLIRKALLVDTTFWSLIISIYFSILILILFLFGFNKFNYNHILILFALPIPIGYICLLKFKFLSNKFIRHLSIVLSALMPFLILFFTLTSILEIRKK